MSDYQSDERNVEPMSSFYYVQKSVIRMIQFFAFICYVILVWV